MAVVVLSIGTAAMAATPASTESILSIRKIDSTNAKAVKVSFIYNRSSDDLSGLTLRENGKVVTASQPESLAKAGINTALEFVVDTSRSMGINGGLAQTKESIRKAVAATPAGDEIGIVTFDTTSRIVVPLTSDHAKVLAGVNDMASPPDGKTALWDGLEQGAEQLAASPKLQPNLVLITDGYNDSSTTTKSLARTALTRSGAAVYALAYNQQNQVDGKTLNGLVDLAGGQFFVAPRTQDLALALNTVQSSLQNQYVITYASQASPGANSLELNVNGVSDIKTFVPGSIAQGGASLNPPVIPKSILPAFLQNGLGRVLAIGTLFLAVALGVYAVALLVMKDETALDNVLMPYTDGGIAPEADDDGDGALAQTALLQRAVDLTEDFAERQGFLVKIEKKLEQANLPLRAAEAIFFWLAGFLIFELLFFVLYGFMGIIVGGLLFGLAPYAVLNFLGSRRQKQFNAQLPDMLQLLAGSLRAGYSLMQGVEAVSVEVHEPMGKELRRVVTEARLGRELEESMDGIGERMNSADFEWAVMAIRIQREVGGNLSELLNTVGETMIERERLRREVAALTAEGKISAIVLGILPPAIGGVMYMVNSSYMHSLISTGLGHGMLITALVMMLIGFAWMKKCIQIEI
jgi:tight adherence protein B